MDKQISQSLKNASLTPCPLDQVKHIILSQLTAQKASARVYLFGSWARGEQRRSSDIDVAIEHQGDLAEFVLTKIRYELEESDVPYRVDVVDLSEADGNFAAKVKKEGVLWLDY